MELPEHRVVLSGVGMSAIGRRRPESGLRLTLDAIKAAVDDAGLAMTDIDGIASFPGPVVEPVPGFAGPDMWVVADALRLKVNWQQAGFLGAAQIGPIIAAMHAIAAGLCRHVVVFRTTGEGSAQGGGPRSGMFDGTEPVAAPFDFASAVGMVSPVSMFAFYAQRYMSEFGLSREQLAWLAIVERSNAARNPWAVYQKPLDLETYMSSPMISSPLCLYDCDVPVDVSTAFVVSAIDAAPDLRAPVRINAVATAMRGRLHYTEWEDMTTMVSHELVKQLWTRTELTVDDIDTAQLYDGFSIITLLWLEAIGICGRGEAGAFIEGGERISLGGKLPINTWGGQMSAGRLHGFGYPAEAMRQLRGEATGRQVPDAEVALAGVGAAHWGGAMLLTRW